VAWRAARARCCVMHDRAPILALATPPGRGALAVVRLAGVGAFDLAAQLCQPWPLSPRRATLAALRAVDGRLIDRALVVAMPGPASFTGDDTVEFTVHGGPAVVAALLEAGLALGAREARAGEFTRRAVLSGRLDLAQAEAIGSLVDANSEAMRAAAVEQLDGGLSRRVHRLRDALVDLEALLAYDIDFPEEDDGPIAPARIAGVADDVHRALAQLLATAPAGEALREGANVVLAGAPNVGKSSLFNALLGRARALVTPEPGTTRDAIEAVLETPRWPVRLVDTAGLRETSEPVERLGIEVSVEAVRRAAVVLACGDTAQALAETLGRLQALATVAPIIAVLTKRDLHRASGVPELSGAVVVVPVSAESGEGLSALVAAVLDQLDVRYGRAHVDQPRLLRERQVRAVRTAHEELGEFLRGWRDGVTPVVISATHVRGAIDALEAVVGVVSVDEVLDRLFATFCVGK
jgi:tRNA modification GTPase